MGHSVETLVSTYVGALDGDESVANDRIDTVLGAVVTSAVSPGAGQAEEGRLSGSEAMAKGARRLGARARRAASR
jgi:hypothetical protein